MTRVDEICQFNTPNFNKITNCSVYLNADWDAPGDLKTRCAKCETKHTLNKSQTECLADEGSESAIVEHCSVVDGTWCRRCLRGVSITEGGVAKTINYILTDENTCIREPDHWAEITTPTRNVRNDCV